MDLYGSENPLKEKTITTRLNNIGFSEYKEKRDKISNKYRLNPVVFDLIVKPICPELCNYSTSSTYSTSLKGNIKNNGVESIKKGVEKCLIKKE